MNPHRGIKQAAPRKKLAAKTPAAMKVSARAKAIGAVALVTMLIAGASRRRGRVIIAITVALCLFAGLTMLAYSPALNSTFSRTGQIEPAQTVAPASFTTPSKEYIYAGGRLVATEEPQSCAPLLTPTYQSFPATPGTASPATIGVTIGSGCSWTASTNASWITFPVGSSGSGNGTLTYSVAQNTSATIRNGLISIGGQSFTVYQGLEFADVPTSHMFYSFIGRLAARGVTVGCGTNPPIFCPDSLVPHEQMATFVMRAKGEPNPPTPPSQRFADVPPSNPFYAFIDRMDVLNIWNGCGTNQSGQRIYCPASNVKREEMAAIIIRGIGEFNPPTPSAQRFNDVSPSNPFYNFIDRMAVLAITSGCSASPPLYCPTASVTRGQMAVFLVRAFKL